MSVSTVVFFLYFSSENEPFDCGHPVGIMLILSPVFGSFTEISLSVSFNSNYESH